MCWTGLVVLLWYVLIFEELYWMFMLLNIVQESVNNFDIRRCINKDDCCATFWKQLITYCHLQTHCSCSRKFSMIFWHMSVQLQPLSCHKHLLTYLFSFEDFIQVIKPVNPLYSLFSNVMCSSVSLLHWLHVKVRSLSESNYRTIVSITNSIKICIIYHLCEAWFHVDYWGGNKKCDDVCE